MAKIVKLSGINAPIGVNRFKITEEERNGKKEYLIENSRDGVSWSGIGELSLCDLAELSYILREVVGGAK
jgi:hypothetical protein